MPQSDLSGPDLPGVVADANAAELKHVVIGGFSVIFHGFIRATRDSDLLVPDGEEANRAIQRFAKLAEARRVSDGEELKARDVANAEQLKVTSRHGIVDLVRGGVPPLDFETVYERAETIEWEGQTIRIAALSSVVGFKRLAGRPQDRLDLEKLEGIHGALPVDSIPGVDPQS